LVLTVTVQVPYVHPVRVGTHASEQRTDKTAKKILIENEMGKFHKLL